VKWLKNLPTLKLEMAYLGLASSQQTLMDSFDKESALQKKVDEIKKQLKIQEGAFLASLPDIEKDKTYCHYYAEKQRVNKKMDSEAATFDSKIATLEAKKKATIDEIDSKIEKIENDKKRWQEKLDDEALRYEKEMGRVREKIENAVPTSLTYRKLKESLGIAEEEYKVSLEERNAEQTAYEIANKRAQRQAQEEADRKMREQKRLEKLERDEALAALDARLARENKESLERQRQRDEEARKAKK